MSIREDVHMLVAHQMDRTDERRKNPILCDYLADLARLFVNLLEEEAQFQHSKHDMDPVDNADEWRRRVATRHSA